MLRTLKPFEAFPTYTFRDPDTARIFGPYKEAKDLYVEIIQYREQNKLEPLEFLRETVEHYLCSLPENTHRCKSIELHRSAWTYVKGGIQLFKNMWYKNFVSQEVAEVRAAQCVKCPHNVFPDKNAFMAFADDVAISQVGEKKVSAHNQLASCEICSCPLRGKVFFGGTLPKFSDEEVNKMRAVSCWQLKLSNQE